MSDEVPRFLYGTAWKEADTTRCVEAAIDAGFRGIDTANQRRHYVEEGVGDALRRLYERGVTTRDELFLQTKFTSRNGQDHRLPYDPNAPLADQVRQSFESSLDHLGTDRIDSYVLHGPCQPMRWSDADDEIWRAMEALHQQGMVGALGVSNVSLMQLRALCDGAKVMPKFVQNRCFARRRWDAEVRAFCRDRGIVYQGFSLLTANGEIAADPRFVEIVRRTGLTPAQVVFAFALAIGMIPLTGTKDPAHMREDLAALEATLSRRDLEVVENLALS